MNIAYSCRIFKDEMDGVFVVEGTDRETALQELRYTWEGSLSLDPRCGPLHRRRREEMRKGKQTSQIAEILYKEVFGLQDLECGWGNGKAAAKASETVSLRLSAVLQRPGTCLVHFTLDMFSSYVVGLQMRL